MYNKYFRCYSVPLKKYLMDHGFRYIWVGKNEYTKNIYWDFDKTTELDKYLKQWSNNKPNKKTGGFLEDGRSNKKYLSI